MGQAAGTEQYVQALFMDTETVPMHLNQCIGVMHGSQTHKTCPELVPSSAIIAIGMIVAIAHSGGPHQGQWRPSIVHFVVFTVIWQAYWSSPIVAIVAIGTVAIADAEGTGGNVIYIIAIGTIVATADAGGPHQGQCGFRRPSIALFVPRNDKSSIYSNMSSILKQSRAGAIVAIVAIGTIIAIADAGGPYQGQCGCWRPSIAIFVARNNKIPGVVIVAIVAIVAIADAGGTGGDIIIILD
ncbi:hypothetical protein GGX14DRAFT_389634 [Mycena pura]|uniref:Uncharacterized protein n=1 Tax=Mycena pura TaxID=153505 RepID=A0AAD6VU84_9AGAR|nr:hypothetical protein GGX14DRAFT_389634 [Mycena pura]